MNNNSDSEHTVYDQSYRRMIYIGSLIGASFLTAFSLIDTFILKLQPDGVVEAIGSVILFLIAYMENKAPVRPGIIISGLVVVALILGNGVFANVSADGSVIWLPLLPFLCFFLLGEKQGLKVSLFISFLYISALTFASLMLPEKGFNINGIIAASGALLCSVFLAMAYEKHRVKMINLLAKQAKTDPLTSLLNRRGFMSSFNLLMPLSKRSKQGLCLLIMDLDKFKSINDNFGHDIGDLVIVECAKKIKSIMRDIDCIARLGGEEFIALLPNTSISEAEVTAHRIRAAIENLQIPPVDNININVTVSIGVTHLSNNRTSFDELYKAADEALYEAKNSGRNCIVYKV